MSGFAFLTLPPVSSLLLGRLGKFRECLAGCVWGGHTRTPGGLQQHPALRGCRAACEGSRALMEKE